MSKAVLDASVVIALLRDERFDSDLITLIEGAFLSAVNLSEVLARLSDESTAGPRTERVLSVLKEIVPFTESQARLAASLRAHTKHLGLSLGDRACLSLAIELDADVYTADRTWSQLKLPCRIHLIR